jgi:hypothetical protein
MVGFVLRQCLDLKKIGSRTTELNHFDLMKNIGSSYFWLQNRLSWNLLVIINETKSFFGLSALIKLNKRYWAIWIKGDLYDILSAQREQKWNIVQFFVNQKEFNCRWHWNFHFDNEIVDINKFTRLRIACSERVNSHYCQDFTGCKRSQ